MMDSALRLALTQDSVTPLMLLEIAFKNGTTRVHSGLGEIIFEGQKFLGLGDIGKVSVIRQESGDRPDRLNLTLSSFDDSVRGEALEARYVGQPVKLWLAVLDDDWRIKASQMIWRGSISDGGVTVGENNQITLTVSNRLEDWDKARPDRYTDESQNSRHPGDRIFIYMPAMAEYPIYWGSEKSSIPLKDSV
ncbi:hypothetical protein [uncultured Endozoicomonas sp.]|uniref:hypothetical protein n=1 Tax=uncultured Endozoicomonas sp. TaxID=432652 RepID=UPI00263791FC|nr:hypothetical protein [uncultured Endozoicomonas sp.]